MPVRWRLRMTMAILCLLAIAMVFAAALATGLSGLALGGLAAGLAALCLLADVFVEAQISRPLEQVFRQAQSVASGQPGHNVQLNRVDEIGMILRAVNQSGLNLRSLVDDVSEQISGVQAASSEIAQGNNDLSARTEQAASNLEETAASMEQMTSSVKQSADTARMASSLAGQASQAAGSGGDVVGQVAATSWGRWWARCRSSRRRAGRSRTSSA